ncbi:MAG TPA: TetR/AcrR family transcriptional regulator [Mariprofundaceae bacterium]|nr:TetR/AcrR family transcriptional regulator [Mariprofundaceae bacterium]
MADAERGTHERLLNTAVHLLWERSYQGTSVDELCRKAGIRKGSFYHFFRSKADLAAAAIDAAWRHTEQAVFAPIFGSDEGGMAQLERLIDRVDEIQGANLKSRGLYLGCPFGNLGQEMANVDEAIRQAVQRVFARHCDYIEAALQRAGEDRDIPPGDMHRRAEQVFALFEGALLMAKVAKDPALFRGIAASVRAVAAA